MGAELSVIIPTYNERDNIRLLLKKIGQVLDGVSWEAIFVDDDSRDGTNKLVREIALHDSRVRCLQRIGRRGLSSACIEGILASSAPYLAVMDADLQHDESLLPKMLKVLKSESVSIVIGSRYIEGGGADGLNKARFKASRLATFLAKFFLKAEVSDPMSGFFMLKRSLFEKVVYRFNGRGFKILADIFASAPGKVSFKELPFSFRKRHSGESKLDMLVMWEYFILIADKLIGRFIPVNFVMFVFIALGGAVVHIGVLGFLLKNIGFNFQTAQLLTAIMAITANFLLNNIFTSNDLQLKGWHFLRGIGSFYIACSVGAVANIYIATSLYNTNIPWWMAGVLGAIIGFVWNYAVSSTFTWRKIGKNC